MELLKEDTNVIQLCDSVIKIFEQKARDKKISVESSVHITNTWGKIDGPKLGFNAYGLQVLFKEGEM